jgi:hypothetical protein
LQDITDDVDAVWKTFKKFVDPPVGDAKKGSVRGKIHLYTSEYVYAISFSPSQKTGEGDRDWTGGYLGCIASCRKERPGEDWTRGRDLPDGQFTVETFERIIHAIVRAEIGDSVKELQLRGDAAFARVGVPEDTVDPEEPID